MELRGVVGHHLAAALSRAPGIAERRAEPAPGLVALGLLLLAALVRIQTFGNPVIGFDEQFYLLVGDRMWNHHALPYVDIFDRKPVGLFLIYAFVRMLGGEGVLQYQLVALACVAATAFIIYRLARLISSTFGALVSAALYILWLNFMECEGGQAPVFFNLLMVLAALFTQAALHRENKDIRLGCVAMLCTGVALQIKYSVIFEGFFFGVMLMGGAYRAGRPLMHIGARALLWIGCALAPTLLATGYYASQHELQPFLFANFGSIFGRLQDPIAMQIPGLLVILGILAPLGLLAVLGWRHWQPTPAQHTITVRAFYTGWLTTAMLGVIILGIYLNPHYAANVIVPLIIMSAPAFAQGRGRRWLGVAIIGVFFVAGQIVLAVSIGQKGGRHDAELMARAAQPTSGCLYIYDGQPALYLMTDSCLLTRFVFPGSLNTREESSTHALGVDPEAEVRRILAARPEVIVDYAPAYEFGNHATHALVQEALAKNYRETFSLPTQGGGVRLVYRLKLRR
ncbi:MAG: glycosyltransferase family 39 protein [Alphaproteobacteria bacterium]|nr:glycosyltransferase family 39 protein [Alphaproteobacteria bacterium]MDE2340911.1 glycosyltransferase family 39 protein [Alphaproteobacteria bacterium]